jgi:hypothetical protein
MGQTDQTPRTTPVVQATPEKPADPTRGLARTKHRFDDHLTPGVQGASVGGPPVRRHARRGGGGWLRPGGLGRMGSLAAWGQDRSNAQVLHGRGGGRAGRAAVLRGRHLPPRARVVCGHRHAGGLQVRPSQRGHGRRWGWSCVSGGTAHAPRRWEAASPLAGALPPSSQPWLVVRLLCSAGSVTLVWALVSGGSATGWGVWPRRGVPVRWRAASAAACARASRRRLAASRVARRSARRAGSPEPHRPRHPAGRPASPKLQSLRASDRLP